MRGKLPFCVVVVGGLNCETCFVGFRYAGYFNCCFFLVMLVYILSVSYDLLLLNGGFRAQVKKRKHKVNY